jgi:hypothetical protein
VVCDTDGTPVDPATAKRIIVECWTVPLDVRARRRQPQARHQWRAPDPLPRRAIPAADPLDNPAPIRNQIRSGFNHPAALPALRTHLAVRSAPN